HFHATHLLLLSIMIYSIPQHQNLHTFPTRRSSDLKRMNIYEPSQPNFLEKIDLDQYKFLPNTAGAKTAEEAVRIAKLAHASGICHMVKVEIIGCDKTLLPDPVETLKASEQLLDEGFTVLTY